MSKSYENGTKIYELVIDEQGKDFFTQNTLFLDKNGMYRNDILSSYHIS